MSDGLKRRGLSIATKPSPARVLRVVGLRRVRWGISLPDKRIPCPGMQNSLPWTTKFPPPIAQRIHHNTLKA